MACTYRFLVAGAGLLVLVGGSSNAADQGITGKKLLLKSTPKLVLLSKDAAIGIAGSDPVGGADSSISFDAGGGPVTFSLPKTLWSTNSSGTLFKYKNADAPGGPSAVKIVKIKPGLLKVVAKGLPFPVPNGAASIKVVLSLDGGTNTYCMTFAGTGDGNTLLVKDAPAGTCSVCGNGVLEAGEQCDPPGPFAPFYCFSLPCEADCACEDPCPAAFQGCFTGTATGPFGSGSFTVTVNDSSGSLSGTIWDVLPFTGSYECPSGLCGGAGRFTIGYNDISFSFTAWGCVGGATQQGIVGGYTSDPGGPGTLMGGPCP